MDDETSVAGLESSLPDLGVGNEVIGDYGTTADLQGDQDALKSQSTRPSPWIKGKSSLYVDAFNFALDTVLENEAHLFDDRERHVFSQWKGLDYGAQYLYVRLFLRKAASWHRTSSLDYHSDISDMEKTVATLQETRSLPKSATSSQEEPIPGVELEDICLGESFTFADASEQHIKSVKEAAPLLRMEELKFLAKELKLRDGNKTELMEALCRAAREQTGLMSVGIRRSSSSAECMGKAGPTDSREGLGRKNREGEFIDKILAITGPCVRISPLSFKLFERVHLVFYRSTEWTEKSLTTIILAKISRRNFADYIVCRTSNIFTSRRHILEFEAAIRLSAEVDTVIDTGEPPGERGFRRVVGIFENIYPRWRKLVTEEQVKEDTVYEEGEGGYLRRFTPAHAYTRIAHKAAYCFGRLKDHGREHDLLTELLAQRLFHTARRGDWYQRKALLQENYMHAIDPDPVSADEEQQKKHWRKRAAATCEEGLRDRDCHLIYHYDLQKRLVKLERRLRIPRRLQHDFGHLRLAKPVEHTIEGVQIKREDAALKKNGRGPNTKTVWADELEGGGDCSVEELCLSHYRSLGWKGYHAEGGIVRTLFALLFFDIIFAYAPNVFQTAYQTCPLDLFTDAFYPTRASEINRRLAEISNGGAERIVREVYEREHGRKTCVVGLNWEFELEDLAELAGCFTGGALAAVCKVMAQEYKQRGGGIPDLVLWRTGTGTGTGAPECMFAEVKSANDRLSDTQRLWIHVLISSGVQVTLCNVVAREVRVVG